ncbi:MAG: hypothetical protein ACRDK9_04270 [Solirubrobacterales bacterium]
MPAPPEENPFAYDPDRPLRLERHRLENPFELAAANVSFESFDRERVPATLISMGGRRACVILVAGLGSSLEQAARTSTTLAGAGYTALSVEPRFHGSRAAGVGAQEAARDPRLLAQMGAAR